MKMKHTFARVVAGAIVAAGNDDAMLVYYEDHHSEDATAELAEAAGHTHASVYRIVKKVRKSIARDQEVSIVRPK